MQRGRKQKPVSLKIVEGTFRKDRFNEAQPMPDMGRPDMPSDLSKSGRVYWDDFASMLEDMGVLTKADGAALAMLCELKAVFQQATDEIEAHGLMVENGAGGMKANPAVGMRNTIGKNLQSLLSEFGMTPASRCKVTASPKEKRDPAQDYFT